MLISVGISNFGAPDLSLFTVSRNFSTEDVCGPFE